MSESVGALGGGYRVTLGATEWLNGLGQDSYGTKAAAVVSIKDSGTFTGAASGLAAIVGQLRAKRFDFADELASDILGCWTEG